jgi:hypothetical protein
MIVAHIAGIPVEETVLSFGPVALAGGGVLSLKLKQRVNTRRERRSSAARGRVR